MPPKKKAPEPEPESEPANEGPEEPSAADLWFQRKMASYASREQTAEKARVAAKAADDSRRAIEANKAHLRARELRWNVDRVARIAREIDDALAPARLERDARDRGARWTGRPKPIFVSYAPRDASFEELAFVRAFVASLDRAVDGDVDRSRSFVWFDRLDVPDGDLGDDRARGLWRAEACAGAAAVVAVLSPAYDASEQCDLERFVVSNRREPVAWGGPGETVPVIAVDATKGAGFGPLGPTGAFASTPRGLLGEEDPNPTPLGLGDAQAPRADAAAVAAAVLEKLAARGVRVPIDAKLLHEEKVEEVESKKDGATSKKDGAASNDGSLSGSLSGSLPRGSHPHASSLPLFATRRGFRPDGAFDESSARASVAALGGSWRSRPLVEWSEEELDAWLCERGGFLNPYLKRFREERVDGWLASSLDEDALSRYFGVDVAAHRARLLDEFGDIGGRRSDGKGSDVKAAALKQDAADDDGGGRVYESEIVYASASTIHSTSASASASVSSDFPPPLVSGHTRGELERALERAFAEADASGAGTLAPAAFRAALTRLDLGFAPRVVDAMCAHRGDAVDDRDGRVSLRAFTRVAFDIAFAASASDVRAVSATRDATFFRAAVFATLRDAAAGSETITLTPRCRDALFGMGATMGVGLTRAHVAAAMRAAPPCALAGRVAWREFAPLVADALWPRVDPRARRRREDAVAEARARGAWTFHETGLDPCVVGAAFATTFARFDPTRRGVVSLDDAILALDALVRERVVDADVSRAVRATMTPPFTETETVRATNSRGTTGTSPAHSSPAHSSPAHSVRYADAIDFWVDVAAEAERDVRADAAVAAVAEREAATAAREETLRARRAEMDDRIRTREAEIRETLREADVTGALASIAASPAAAAAYLAAARVVETFSQTERVTRTGAAYVGTLAMGTRDSTRVIRIVAATEKHAFVVGKETRAWEGASWPAVGFERLDRTALLPPPKPPTTDEENADPETSPVKRPPPVRTPPGTSRVVDLEDAREGGAVALRRGGDATAPGAFFAAPFVGVGDDAPRGYVAVDTLGWSSSDPTRAGSNPGLVSEEDKMLVTRVAAAVSDALAKTAAATAKERERVREEARREFDADEEGKVKRREAALAALEERRAAAAAEAA